MLLLCSPPSCHPPAKVTPLEVPARQDMADSKRINANVKSVPNTATPLRRRRSLVSCAAPGLAGMLHKAQHASFSCYGAAVEGGSARPLPSQRPILPPLRLPACRWTLTACPPPLSPSSSGRSCPPRSSTCRRRCAGAEVSPCLPAAPECWCALAWGPLPSGSPASTCSPRPPPCQVSAMLATYGAKYRSLKAPRKLQWKPNLGSVQLELTIGDQTLEFNVSAGRAGRRRTGPGRRMRPARRTPPAWQSCGMQPCAVSSSFPRSVPPHPLQVSPFHASVLMHFQTRPEWPAAELAERMGVAPDVLRRKVVFWINQGESGPAVRGRAEHRRRDHRREGATCSCPPHWLRASVLSAPAPRRALPSDRPWHAAPRPCLQAC